MRLTRYFQNLFAAPEFSLAEKLAFSQDHLQRVIANPAGGLFTPLIAPTSAKIATVVDCSGDEQTKALARQSAVLLKNTFRETLTVTLGRIHGALESEYAPSQAEIISCGLHDRRSFGDCADNALEAKLDALVGGLTTLGAPVATQLTRATDALNAWKALYAAALGAKGAVSAPADQKKAAIAALEDQLHYNLHTIAREYPRHEAKADLYFQQHLLEDHPVTPPVTPPAEAPPTFTATPGDAGSKQITFTGSYPAGATTLALYQEAFPGATPELVSRVDAPVTEMVITFDSATSGEVYGFTLRGGNDGGDGPAAGPISQEIP